MKTALLDDVGRKKSVFLSAAVYDSIKDFIMSLLAEKGEVTFTDLLSAAAKHGSLHYEGDRNWCFLLVKRDLEARGIIDVAISRGRNRVQIIRPSKKNEQYCSDRASS